MKTLVLLLAAQLQPMPAVLSFGDLACGEPPPLPAVTELRAVQDDESEWSSYVTAWVSAAAPACWQLGWEPLDYVNDGDPDTPQVMEPMPWLEGIDFTRGAPCPPEAIAGCRDPLVR